MVGRYVPERGDIVLLQFNPQTGKEQAGKRPAFVLSPKKYNAKVGLMLACPITSKSKGYSFEVPLPGRLETHGVILVDQIKSLDWQERRARFIEKAPKPVTMDVIGKIDALLVG